MSDMQAVGERIAYHRKRLGLSQVEFAGLVGRSESWVSQVERGVRPVDRNSVLQKVADVLSVPVTELRDEDEGQSPDADERPEAFDMMRAALTGHPSINTVIGGSHETVSRDALEDMSKQHSRVWELVHASSYSKLAPILASLIPNLEQATRVAHSEELRAIARKLLTDTYQAAAAALSKLGEADAAWVAADRAAFVAESAGEPLTVAASMFRMAHVFLSLGQIGQAQQVANATSRALQPLIESGPTSETFSLYGAFQLVLAAAAARDNDRSEAYSRLDKAREIAARIAEDRNDYDTEFGPSNVAIHAVSIAVELGDAGQALELARDINMERLSAERQSRYLIDLAAAHAMRRQTGEALRDLQEAERIAPEQTRTHRVARDVTRDLLQLSGLRPRPELRELAERFGILP
jgi:transcriptional regulator with XRE-family HTH domain